MKNKQMPNSPKTGAALEGFQKDPSRVAWQLFTSLSGYSTNEQIPEWRTISSPRTGTSTTTSRTSTTATFRGTPRGFGSTSASWQPGKTRSLTTFDHATIFLNGLHMVLHENNYLTSSTALRSWKTFNAVASPSPK
eukprot:m.296856 g.296856  ORF g.296856 m.296856 type:complete len:136 (+) comp16281_c0_seq1:911-1318(+)